MHLIASQPVTTCPLLEYLIKWNEVNQFFLRNPIKPVNGVIKVTDTPGIGMELDEDKIQERKEIAF